MKRKIIQIAVAHPGGDEYPILFALANDGTLWRREFGNHQVERSWGQVKELPETERND